MNPPILNDLIELHLSSNEGKVYLALLEIGQTSAGEIIKKTQLHRSVVYETLDKLISKKLAFKIEKQNIAFFQPADPQRLLEMTQAQQETAKELVPKLQGLLKGQKAEITVYEGVESWRRFWLDVNKRLPVGSINYVAGSLGSKWQEYMGKNNVEKYIKTRLERKIKWKMIVFEKDSFELELLKKYPELHEYRLIDKSQTTEGNFNILGDESVILHSATEPMIIEIKNPTLVKVFKNIFDILWATGKNL